MDSHPASSVQRPTARGRRQGRPDEPRPSADDVCSPTESPPRPSADDVCSPSTSPSGTSAEAERNLRSLTVEQIAEQARSIIQQEEHEEQRQVLRNLRELRKLNRVVIAAADARATEGGAALSHCPSSTVPLNSGYGPEQSAAARRRRLDGEDGEERGSAPEDGTAELARRRRVRHRAGTQAGDAQQAQQAANDALEHRVEVLQAQLADPRGAAGFPPRSIFWTLQAQHDAICSGLPGANRTHQQTV